MKKFSLFLFILFFSKSLMACEILCALGISLGIHTGILGIDFDNNKKPAVVPASQNVSLPTGEPLTIVLAPSYQSTVPAGWTANPTNPSQPIPPILTSPVTGGMWFLGTVGSPTYVSQTAQGTCSASAAAANDSPSRTVNRYSPQMLNGVCTVMQCVIATNVCGRTTLNTPQFNGASSACPYTYTANGSGGCAATSATATRALKPVGTPRQVITNPGGSLPKIIPDPQSQEDYSDMDFSNNQVVISSSTGKKTTVTTDSNTGAVRVTTDTPNAITGNTDREILDVSPSDSSGNAYVTGMSGQTIQGQGTASSGTVVNAGAGTGQGSSSGSGSSNCQGCALESTQQAVLSAHNQVNTKLDQLHQDMQGSGTLDSQTPLDAAQSSRDAYQNAKNSLASAPPVDTSWIPSLFPSVKVGCKPLPINFDPEYGPLSGSHYSAAIDICDKVDLIRQIIAYIFGLSTVVFIVFRFFRTI